MVVCSRGGGGGRAHSFPAVRWSSPLHPLQERMWDAGWAAGCQIQRDGGRGAQGGCPGGGPGWAAGGSAGRGSAGRASSCSAVLLVASRGGSCPSDEVQLWAQRGAGFEQKEGGRGEKKLDCGAGFTKRSPCCSSTPILCVLSQEGIKSLGSVHSSSTVMRDRAGRVCREQF